MIAALIVLGAGGALAQPVPEPETGQEADPWDPLLDAPQPAPRPTESQPATSQPAPPVPRVRLPRPRLDLGSTHRTTLEALRLEVGRAGTAGATTGRRLAYLLLTPLPLELAAIFGYWTAELGRDGSVLSVFPGAIAVGSAALGVVAFYRWGERPGKGAASYHSSRAREAYKANLLRGLGSGLMIGGAVGMGVFGVPALLSLPGGDAGWSGWTWQAWLGGLAYSATAAVSGVVLHLVGQNRNRLLVQRMAIAPLVLPQSRARGVSLRVQF